MANGRGLIQTGVRPETLAAIGKGVQDHQNDDDGLVCWRRRVGGWEEAGECVGRYGW